MKTVDIQHPLDPRRVIHPCCEKARGKPVQAQPTIRVIDKATEATEFGYVLDTGDACGCESRWLAHDWRRGHAEFVQR